MRDTPPRTPWQKMNADAVKDAIRSRKALRFLSVSLDLRGKFTGEVSGVGMCSRVRRPLPLD